VRRLLGRPTGDVLLLLLAVTVCLSIVIAGGAITVIALLHPNYPIGPVTEALVTALQNILFTVLGVAAGRYMSADPLQLPAGGSGATRPTRRPADEPASPPGDDGPAGG
jgi:hypothetical protein